MSEAFIHTERGPAARIGIMSGRDARAPKNFMPLLLAAPLVLFMLAFYALPVLAMLMRSGRSSRPAAVRASLISPCRPISTIQA